MRQRISRQADFEETDAISAKQEFMRRIEDAENAYEDGKISIAAQIYREAFARKDELQLEDDLDIARAYGGYGNILLELQCLGQADAFYDKALAIKKQLLGERHVEVAKTLANKGSIAMFRRKYQQAKACFEEALSIEEGHFGLSHPEVATTCANLALLSQNMRDLEAANRYISRACDILEHHISAQPGSELDAKRGYMETLGQFAEIKLDVEYQLARQRGTQYSKHQQIRGNQSSSQSISESPSSPRTQRIFNSLGVEYKATAFEEVVRVASNVNARNVGKSGNTPLATLCSRKHFSETELSKVDILLKYGALWDKPNRKGETARTILTEKHPELTRRFGF